MQLLLQGQRVRPAARRKEIGIVDEIVADARGADPGRQGVDRGQPGRASSRGTPTGYKIPGGTPSHARRWPQNLPAFPANLRKQLKGANYPAPHHIMAAAVEGAQVDFDNAIEIEGRYFVDLVTGQVAKNMIQAFFFDLQQRQRRPRPPGRTSSRSSRSKIVVLGAGMMGAAIAYVCAKAGIEVVLKDVSHRGRRARQGVLGEAGRQGASSAAAPPRRRATRCWPGSRRPPTRPTPTAPTS